MKQLNRKTIFTICLAILLLYLCIHYLPAAGALVGKLLAVASPLFMGAIIAYIVNLIMRRVEGGWFPNSQKKWIRRCKRLLCMILSYLIFLAVLALVLWLVIPQFINCITTFLEILPAWLSAVVDFFTGRDLLPAPIAQFLNSVNWNQLVNDLIGRFSSGFTGIMQFLISTVTSVFSFVISAFLSIIFSAYFLLEKEHILSQLNRLVKCFLPKRAYEKTVYAARVFNQSFRGYIVGQSIEAVILGCLCGLGMLIFKIPYAAMIATLIAFTALIPVAGAYIGAIIGAFMILTESPIKALIFVVFLVILQQLEGNLIYPKVVGTRMGLPGVWVLAAVLIGGGLMGVMGMFFGVPIAGAIYRIVGDLLRKKEEEALNASSAAEQSVK